MEWTHLKELALGGVLVRLGVVLATAALLVDGLASVWFGRAMVFTDPALRRAEVLAAAMRLSVVLAGWVGFRSFGILWRSQDGEILSRLPIPGRALWGFYGVRVGLDACLPLLISIGALWPLYPVDPALFADSVSTLIITTLLAVLWALYWHVTAAAAISTAEEHPLQQALAGSVTLPERSLLLYSPALVLMSAFFFGFTFFLGVDGLRDGSSLGPLGVGISLYGVGLAIRRGLTLFEGRYYTAATALADGDALDGFFTEAQPAPDYFGQRLVEGLPTTLRPFVARDLRQAWRRNKLTPALVGGLPLALGLLGSRLSEFLPVGLGACVLLAAAAPFHLARQGSDSAWLWVSLPQSLGKQWSARFVSALFYLLLATPGIILCHRQLQGSLLTTLTAAVFLTVAGVNFSVWRPGQVQRGLALWLLVGAALWVSTLSSPLTLVGGAAIFGLASSAVLGRWSEQLIQAEIVR